MTRRRCFDFGMQLCWETEESLVRAECIISSYNRLTGKSLLSEKSGLYGAARDLFEAPFAVLSHGLEPDPVLNYGNRVALGLWEMTWDEFTTTPSRLTAEAPDREQRALLLAEVEAHGFISDYSGVRISRTGARFFIQKATVWNLLDASGARCGQAATFEKWEKV